MKIINKYQCEICKAVFDTEASAKLCESAHYMPTCIQRVQFNHGQAFPKYVDIVFSNDIIVRFENTGVKLRSSAHQTQKTDKVDEIPPIQEWKGHDSHTLQSVTVP